MTKANGIALFKQFLSSLPEECTKRENKEQAAIESELGERTLSHDPSKNWATLKPDATCVPDDILYPVDLRLLNEARETTEMVIDNLFKQVTDKVHRKPRCNRDKARNLFLAIIKKKKPSKFEVREAKRFQLNEIRHNLAAIDTLIHSGVALLQLGTHLYRKLLVTCEVYRQQQEMYNADSCRTANRMVNLAKPHVHPLVRGKARKKFAGNQRTSGSRIRCGEWGKSGCSAFVPLLEHLGDRFG